MLHLIAKIVPSGMHGRFQRCFHRPCGFATVQTDGRGKRKRIYRHQDYRTPYEKLCSLSDWEGHLKDGVRPEQLQRQAQRLSGTQAAQEMQKAKLALLTRCRAKGVRP